MRGAENDVAAERDAEHLGDEPVSQAPVQLTLDDELAENDGQTFGEWVESLPTRLDDAA